MGYQKLIVAFDGSEGSTKALHHGIDYAKKHGAALTVVNVVKKTTGVDVAVAPNSQANTMPTGNGMNQPAPGPIREEEIVAEDPEIHNEKVQAKGDEALNSAKKALEQENVSAKTEVLEGDAAEEIEGYAIAHEADLIIIGSRGLSGLKKVVLGSVSQKVVEKANCPVLVVK